MRVYNKLQTLQESMLLLDIVLAAV